jgi:hypothetical protein
MTRTSIGHTQPGDGTAQLAVVRLAMLAGILLFGAVSWWTRRSATSSRTVDPQMAEILAVLPLAGGVVALIAAVLLRRALSGERDARKQGSLRVIGWATGEMAAMVGAVGYFLTGNVTSYLIGLAVLVFTFIALPLPERG